MKTQHTPGPWIVDDRHIHPAKGLTYPKGIEPETDVIVLVDTDCHANGLLNETDIANLDLIARAPAMALDIVTLKKALNDCREVLRDLPSWRQKHTRTQTAYESAMAALKTSNAVLVDTSDQYSAKEQAYKSEYRQLLAQHESLVEEHGKLKEELSSLPASAPALLSENARLREALEKIAARTTHPFGSMPTLSRREASDIARAALQGGGL